MFLGVFGTLGLTFLACFTLLGIFLSSTYEQRFVTLFNQFVLEFSQELARTPKEELSTIINNFAFENHAIVSLEIGDEIINSTFYVKQPEVLVDVLGFSIVANHGATGERLALNIELSRQPVYQVVDIVQEILPYLFSLTLLVSLAFAWISTRRLVNPIIEISKVSKKMQQLNLKVRCNLKRRDEIGVLAYNLNEMADKVERSLAELKKANLLLNNYKKQQKEFFIAVSHELKTPLTVLRTQLEGMLKNIGDYQNRELHLKLALETTDGMNDLIKKLLNIAKMQSSEANLKKSHINLGNLVAETCQKYKSFALQKIVSLTYFCENDVMVFADKMRLELAVSNIFSNAIIHSPKSGLVDIQLSIEKNTAILTIENYDAKINKADLPHIFEPFYRTDKSRSRYTGGSGLGLYLTKSILDLHGLTYALENSDNGVRFRLNMPLSHPTKEHNDK